MSAAREQLAALIQRAIEDNRLCARTLKGVCQFCGKSPHDEHTPECCFRQQENTLLAIQRGVTCSSLRAPQSGRDYKALAEAYLDERVLVETMPRKRPDLVRDFAKWLAGSGAETPPQPPPIYVYNGPHEGFKVLHFPELPNDRAVVLGPSDKLELRWVTPPQPEIPR